jgi:predicted ribosome quality control (RQC) complex YloA/Tae2 family protein
VIRNGGQPVHEETLHLAAQLAAYYSSLRGERAVPVAYTQRRFVSRAPGGRTGQVYVRNEQTITVRAELPAVISDE